MKAKKKARIIATVLLILCCICTLIPCVFMIITSLRTTEEIVKDGLFGNIQLLHWENYVEAWQVGRFSKYFLNSVIITFISVVAILLFSLLGAYAYALQVFRGKRIYELMILMGLVIPLEIIIIPLYYDIQNMDLMNTHWAVILPTVAMNMPFGIFLLSGFIRDIPKSLLESAKMDGINDWQTIWYIITPIIRAALISLLIFTFMWAWNAFMLPNIMIKTEAMRTLPLGLDFFRGKKSMNLPLVSAASVIISLPVIILYLIFQKNIIQGMMVGAVKG